MKGTLEFDLFTESADFQTAVDANRFLGCLQDFDERLRKKAKYEEVKSMTIEDVRALLRECAADIGIEF